jgi:hypothetical protein
MLSTIFVFFCGFIFALALLVLILYVLLVHLSTTVAKERTDLLELVKIEQQESKKWTLNGGHSGLYFLFLTKELF